jgi:hypothetical protein
VSSPENGYCGGACREKHIRSIGDFQSLKYCSRVHTLNIYNIATVDARGNHFNEAFTPFGSLEQIDHEFTIHNVKVFSTLSIFSRLHHIGITANATITIEENEFLTELWPSTQPPPIIQGSLNIVRNARLCLKHIRDFVNYTTFHERGLFPSRILYVSDNARDVLELQVTPNTYNEYANGYLASCESNYLRISVEKIRSLTARVNVAVPKELFFRSSGKAEHLRRPFLSVYYKPTKTKNETHFDATQSHKWSRLVEKVNYSLAPHGKRMGLSLFQYLQTVQISTTLFGVAEICSVGNVDKSVQRADETDRSDVLEQDMCLFTLSASHGGCLEFDYPDSERLPRQAEITVEHRHCLDD